MSETSWAYLAGVIDGEGSISVYQNGPRLSITNTYLPLLEWIKEFTETGRVWEMKKPPRPNITATKPCYQWDCSSRAIRRILPKVIPYLRIKKRKAELLLEYVNGINPDTNRPALPEELVRRENLIAQMKRV